MYDPARDSWDHFAVEKRDEAPRDQQQHDQSGVDQLFPGAPHSRAQGSKIEDSAPSSALPVSSAPSVPPPESSEFEFSQVAGEPMSFEPATDDAVVDQEGMGTTASPAGTAGLENGSAGDKKRKFTDEDPAPEQKPASNGPASKRKRREERHQKLKRRANAPASTFSRRDRSRSPERTSDFLRDDRPQRTPSPVPPPRSPTPEAQARQRKRPGGGSRMGIANREVLRHRQEERERAQTNDAQRALRERGVSDLVRQHYNTVPERGKEWRRTESKIKGLRSFNNWIKSTLIQKFSPDEEFIARFNDNKEWAEDASPPPMVEKPLLVLDLGCGKGGDLGKWQQAPQAVELYVGLDPADISIDQARDRYIGMRSGRGRGPRGGHRLFYAEFYPKDCFGEWIGDIGIIQQIGIDPSVGPGGSMMTARWGGGGFDVVSSMFTIHYAFESEQRIRQLLSNVAGSLRKGGRFIGVCPNSDVISTKVEEFHKKRKERETAKVESNEAPEDGEVEEEIGQNPEWGNSIYQVRFPGSTPEDGVFRPPFGWKYSYYMEEAVEEVPEYVVPWEAFRALTEDYNLELQYRKPFLDVWREEKDDPDLGPLSERMGVRERGGGQLTMTEEEKDAVSFYHAFCFYKV